MISQEEFDKLSNRQNELRKQRNEYADKQQEIQREIDELEVQKYDAEQFVGKIVLCRDILGAVYHTYEYMIVDRVERLYAGPRFYGKSINITYSSSYKIGNSIQMWERSEWSGCTWDALYKLKTVDPEHVKNQINNLLYIFDYGEEMNLLKE